MEELNLNKKNGEILSSGEWNSIISALNIIIRRYNTFPEKVSDFENDSGYLTEENLLGIASEEYVRTAIQNLIDSGVMAGPKGEDGITPSINQVNKHWYIGNTDTGIVAEGQNGLNGFSPEILVSEITGGHRIVITDSNTSYTFDVMNGVTGLDGQTGSNGADGKSAYELYVESVLEGEPLSQSAWLESLHGTNGSNGQNGSNGKSAYELAVLNGYSGTLELWLISLKGTDGTNGTNGTNGITPHIDASTKHWMIDQTDTGIVAEGINGSNGTNGTNGLDGITPHIDSTTGNWFIGTTDTGVHAQGPTGNDGSNGTNGTNGADGVTPTVIVTSISNGHNVAFNYGSGDSRNTNFDVMDGNVANQLQADWNQTNSNQADYIKNKPIIPTFDPTNGHDYVEIGGIKWATMNVGATSITDSGLYFQWGDTQGYTAAQVGTGSGQKIFKGEDYKYGNGTSSPSTTDMTKYNETDGKTVLDASDDAVTAAWGSNWRIPTNDEFQALCNAVNTEWVTNYQGSGVNGTLMTDKNDSSKVLFFPACGDAYNGNVNDVGSYGGYWSGSLSSDVRNAYNLYFSSWNVDLGNINGRGVGFCVRGVLNESVSPILHKVSFTGNYNDLNNKPTIPTKTSDLINDSKYLELNIVRNDHTVVDLNLSDGTLFASSVMNDIYKYGRGYSTYSACLYDYYVYKGIENPLNKEVDAAFETWGGDWHLPTKEQFEQLIDGTNYTWETIDNIAGGKFTSKTDSNKYIFLPALGVWYRTTTDQIPSHDTYYTDNNGTVGYYLSSTPYDVDNVYILTFNSSGASISTISRDYGCNVCPAISTYTTTSNVSSSGSYLDLSNTPTVPIISSNHEYVDLGLPSGTLWLKYQLSYNGESEIGSQCSWVIDAAKRYNKDVGNYILGESWHLPTKKLIEELIEYTTPSVIEYNSNIIVRLTSNIDNTKYLDFNYYYSPSSLSDDTHTFMGSTKYRSNSLYYCCLKFTFSNENTSVSTSLNYINPWKDNLGGRYATSCLKCVLDGTPTIIPTIWRGTQALYDALSPNYDSNTIYIITTS